MENKDKWIDNLRRRLKNHSEPVASDLWDRLEQELERDTPKVIPMWRRPQIAAAVALLMIASSLTMWFWNSSSVEYIEQQSIEAAALSPVATETLSDNPTPEQPMAQVASTLHQRMRVVAEIILPSSQEEAESKEGAEVEQQPEERKEDNPTVAAQQQQQQQQVPTEPQKRAMKRSAATKYAYITPTKRKETNWSVGLSTGNMPYTAQKSFDGLAQRLTIPRNTTGGGMMQGGISSRPDNESTIYPSFPIGTMEYAYNQVRLNSQGGKSDVKHKTPITLGASVRIGLDDKWAIETGLTYTMLSTELHSGDKGYYYEQEQKLHYVGIPLKLSRRLWSSRRFEVYGSAGGMVEKSVSGKLTTTYVTGSTDKMDETEKIKLKPLQWSLSAAAGAQFKITEQLGFYAEPGVVYYFDDGSNVSTIRKEHPFNFNIQLGVRFTLPK